LPHRSRTPSPRRGRRAGIAGALALATGLLAASPAGAVNYVRLGNGATVGIHDAAAPGLDTGSIRTVESSAVTPIDGATVSANGPLHGFGNIRVAVGGAPAPRLDGEMMRGFGLRFDGLDRFKGTRAVALGPVSIERSVRVGRADGWVRYLDTFTNTSSAPIEVDVSFGGQVGQNTTGSYRDDRDGARTTYPYSNQGRVVDSSSGDAVVTNADSWFQIATDSASAFAYSGNAAVVLGSPAPWPGFLGLGNQQRNPFASPLETTGTEANFRGIKSRLTLSPGESSSLLRFVAIGKIELSNTAGQQVDAVADVAADLAAAPVLDDLSTGEICALANWDVATLPGFDAADCDDVQAPERIGAVQASEPVTSSPYDVVGKSLAQLQADMEAGKTTSEEITRAYLDRIGAYDTGQLGYHAFIHVADDAIEQAKAADKARAEGKRSPVLGIPVAVKDLYDTKDMPTTGGTLALEGWQPRQDAFQVAKLRDAGAVMIGKANLSEFANSGSMSESGWMQTWNGLYPSKTSFGSSGGSAAAVATSMATFALGSQTGVSLYAPTTGHSLVTMRGTDGISSTRGAMPLTWAQDFAGPIARTVTDLAYILNVTNGTDPGELVLTREADARKVPDYTAHLDANALRGKKVGYVATSFRSSYADEDGTGAAMLAKLDALRAAGAEVVEVSGVPSTRRSVLPSGSSLGIEGWERYIAENPDFPYPTGNALLSSPKVLPYNRRTTTSRPLTDPEVDAYLAWRAGNKVDYAAWMDANGLDAVVYPGFISDMWDNDSSLTGSDRGTNVPTSNFGLPTVVVPVGTNPHGYSMSFQLVGRAWSDAEVLGMGYALEQQTRAQVVPDDAPPLRYVPGSTPRPIVIERPIPPVTQPERPTVPEEAPKPVAKKPIKVVLAKAGAVRGGKARFLLRNAAATRVTGTVTLRAKVGRRTVVLGRGRVSVASKQRATVMVTLTRAARRALGRRARIVATATYALRNPSGTRATKRAKLTIRLR
jgi:amidase